MIDPPRLSSFGGDASDLLRSAHDDGPSAEARRRTAAALGIALATTTAATVAVTALTTSKVASVANVANVATVTAAAKATAATATATKTGAIGGTALALKVIGATLVGSVLAAGTVAIVKPEAFYPRSSETAPASEIAAANAKTAARSKDRASVAVAGPVASPATSVPTVVASELPQVGAAAGAAAAAPNDIELAATPAPPPASRPAPSAAVVQAGDLDGEVSALDGARTKLAAGDGAGALAALDVYKHTFPNGALAPESTVMRIEALHKTGDDFKARSLGEAFLVAHPNSPQARRVRSLLDRMAATPEN